MIPYLFLFLSVISLAAGPDLAPFQVSLYSGIRRFVAIGDSEAQVKRNAKWEFVKKDPPLFTKSSRFTHYYSFKSIGTKVWFRDGKVVLIELQEPFRGVIQGKKINLFDFKNTNGKPWEEKIVREFGPPDVRASGGRFGTEAFFYTWGDLCFNNTGVNQVAIYHDKEVAKHRQNAFGKEVILFKE